MYKIPVLHAVHLRGPTSICMCVYILPNPTKIYTNQTTNQPEIEPIKHKTKIQIKYPKPILRLANLLLAEELEIPNTNTQVEQ